MDAGCAARSVTAEFIFYRRGGIKLPSAALEPDAAGKGSRSRRDTPPRPPGGVTETLIWGTTGCPPTRGKDRLPTRKPAA